MTFVDLVGRLKTLPFDDVRKEYDGYFEFVIASRNLTQLYPLFETYYGVPFKPAGIEPTPKAQNVSKKYGGIQKQQTLYYSDRDGVADCAMIWPWSDGSRATVKMARGVIGEKEA